MGTVNTQAGKGYYDDIVSENAIPEDAQLRLIGGFLSLWDFYEPLALQKLAEIKQQLYKEGRPELYDAVEAKMSNWSIRMWLSYAEDECGVTRKQAEKFAAAWGVEIDPEDSDPDEPGITHGAFVITKDIIEAMKEAVEAVDAPESESDGEVTYRFKRVSGGDCSEECSEEYSEECTEECTDEAEETEEVGERK